MPDIVNDSYIEMGAPQTWPLVRYIALLQTERTYPSTLDPCSPPLRRPTNSIAGALILGLLHARNTNAHNSTKELQSSMTPFPFQLLPSSPQSISCILPDQQPQANVLGPIVPCVVALWALTQCSFICISKSQLPLRSQLCFFVEH
jgi:hypothetical protein